MIRRVTITNSRSLDGMHTLLSSRNVKDGVNLDLLDEEMMREDTRKKGQINFMERRKDEEVQVRDLCLDPTGRFCAVVHNTGVSIYGLKSFFSKKEADSQYKYSKSEILDMASRKDYFSLIIASLTIEDDSLTRLVINKVELKEAEIFVQMIPKYLVGKLLTFFNWYLDNTKNV